MALKLTRTSTGKTWSSTSKKAEEEKEEKKTTGATKAPVEEKKQTSKSGKLTLTRSSSAPVVSKQEDDEPDFFERIGKILSGAGKATTSDYTNAAGTLYQGGQSGRTARNQELLEEYQYGLSREQKKMADLLAANKRSPGTFSAKEIQSQQYLIDDWQRKVDSMTKVLGENVQEKATTATYGIVDNLQEKSQQDIERAKQGLGAVGQFAVDAGVAGAQLAGDIGLAALSGGSTMAPMAARVFGGSAGEARRAGATYGQQVAYGASSALVSTLTERISNVAGPFKKAFGTGMLDDALAKVTAKPMGKILVSALSEGGEEILEAIMQPLLQKMTYNPDAAYDSEWFADMLYSGAIGAVLGGMGGVADPSTYRRSTEPVVEAQPAGLAPAEQEQTAEGTLTPEAVTAVEGEKTAPAHVGIQDAYRAGRANVPRDKVSFISEEQEEAYMRGRRDHIKYASDSELAIENQQAAEYTGINNQEDANYGTEVHLREGGERADGTYPGRPVSAVEESAGRNQSRKATVRPADGEAANLSYGKKVSTASLGIEGGSTSDGVFLVKGSTKATEAAQRYAAERGMDLVLFMGHDLHTNEAPEGARGLRDGNKLYVRADDPDFTAEQIARHEGGHDMIAKGEVDIAKVRERVAKAVGGGDMSKASALYAAAYSGTTLTADDIWEECICDSLAGMNIFAEVAPEVASFMEGVLSVTKQEAETSRQAPRGPPADAGTNKHSFRIGGNKDERRRDAQRAFEASETLRWDEDELNRERREAVERRGAFSQRMAASNATTKRVGHLLYGYLSIPTRKASDYGKECASEFKKIGVDNFFIYDGEVQVNYAGKTIGHSSDGVTLEDGSIGINNRASAEDGGMTPKNVAAHEAIHQRLDNKDAAALAYQSTLMQNIDRHSGTFKMYASAINFGYFKYKLNPKSESHALRFASEFAAYVGGHMYSGDVDPSGMIRDYEAVRKALEKALGVKIPAKKQYSHRVSDARIEEIRKAVEAGKPLSATDEVHYSRRFDREFMQAAINANARYKRVSDKNMTEAARVRQAVADIFNDPELAESLGLPPDILGNTYIPNGSYSGTEENTTECIRTLAADELMDAVAEVLGRPLTVEDTIAISQEYWKYTDKPECLYCYVAMDRKAHREFLGAYLKQRDDAIRNVKNGMSKEDAYQNFLDGRKDTKPMKKRFDMWMKNMGGEMISPADLASRASMEKAAGRSANIKAQVNDALKYAQSASWAKKRISYTAYNNHILKWKQSRIDNLNGNYGLRMYSFADFSPAFILENMQMVTDAAVRGLKVLAYTKEMAFAKIFAKTGMNINISVFGYDDGNGGVAMDGMQGADWAEAQQLRSQYPNVGCTFVATNDSQVAWALDQDWIDVIIPFHMVRTGTKVANYFGWKNYTAMSADTKNKNWTKGDAKHILPPEHQNNKAMYLRACEENHLTPRFNDWVDHPNYMKLVNETRQSEGNTKPVQPIFDLDAAEASIEEMGKRGGYYQPIGGTRDLMQELAEEIAETVEKKLGGVKHSRRLTADDNAYIKALENGDAETAQKMVDDAAKAAGFNIKLHHGTAAEPFYVFRQGREGIHFGTFSQAIHRAEVSNKEYKFRGDEYSVEDIRKNPGKIPDSARKRIIFEMLNFMAVDLTQEERNKAAGSLYSDAPISNKDFLYYLGKAEKSGRKEWTLTNDVMGKTGKKRVISAWVKAQHPMTIGTDLGSWSPFKLASVLIDKINGKSSNLYNYQSGIDEQFDPSTIKGIKLTEADLPALRELQDSKNFEDVAKFLQSKGVDSIRYLNTYEGTGDEESYILLSPEQVKSADPATYDDNGDAIPLSERFNAENKDIRFSQRIDTSELKERLNSIMKEREAQGLNTGDQEADARAAAHQLYEILVEEYGAIIPGEKPYRDAKVPKQTTKRDKVSQTVRTVMEAEVTPDEVLPNIKQLIASGDFSYDVYTDEAAISDAEATITKVGWAQSLADWTESMKKGIVSKQNTAMGWALYNNAVNSGDVDTALTVLDYMVKRQRNAAQALQATRILKKLSPATQLYQAQRSVESLQEELNQRYGNKKAPELKIDEELAERYMKAEDQTERDEIMKDIYRDIGRQMPSRFIDRWNAWRYLAMLGNLRTHGRNLAGNAGFAPVVVAKNVTATFIEWAVNGVSRGKLNRSKAMVGFGKNDRALLKAAWSDYSLVQEAALSGGKFDDFANANKYIEEGRKIFGNTKSKLWNATGGNALEAARKANSKALDKEDMWFSQPHYAAALASYCKAHSLTAEQIAKGKEITNARAYAIKEAQKATYRDTNALSQTISQMRFKKPDNAVKKGINVASEGLLPFRKTPANILARGVEYSPLGLLNGLKQAVFDVRKGKKTGAEAIDSISAGLTGTGLLALGVYLAAQGLVRGHGGDDDDKKEFEEMMGHQAYSLEMPDGTSVTLDWLAPECLPLFVGVNLWEQTEGDDDLMFKDVLAAVSTVTEPLLEMSCLQSLNDLFEAFGYAGSNDMSGLVTAASSAATSYITQALPTLLGQAERTGEEDRMTTYTEKNSQLPNNWQYVLGRASSRIPGWDYHQIPYIDAWGREEANGSALERGLNNFLNPSYVSEINTSSMEKELLRLYEATGEASVFPSRAPKYFNVGNKRKDLTADEYVRYATKKGKTAYNVLSSMTKSKAYKSMSNAEKVEAVSLAYEYANAVAKSSVSAYKAEGWVANALAASAETGIKADQYVAAYVLQADIVSLRYADGRDKNKDGKADSVDNSKGLQIMKKIYTIPGLTDAQRQQLFIDFGVGKTIRHYGPALVDQKLAAMKKYAK